MSHKVKNTFDIIIKILIIFSYIYIYIYVVLKNNKYNNEIINIRKILF